MYDVSMRSANKSDEIHSSNDKDHLLSMSDLLKTFFVVLKVVLDPM
jgi:hypothetical protein